MTNGARLSQDPAFNDQGQWLLTVTTPGKDRCVASPQRRNPKGIPGTVGPPVVSCSFNTKRGGISRERHGHPNAQRPGVKHQHPVLRQTKVGRLHIRYQAPECFSGLSNRGRLPGLHKTAVDMQPDILVKAYNVNHVSSPLQCSQSCMNTIPLPDKPYNINKYITNDATCKRGRSRRA